MVGLLAEPRCVVQKIYGGCGDSEAHRTNVLPENIQEEAQEEHEVDQLRPYSVPIYWQWAGPWKQLFSEGRYRRALAIACLLQALQQLCGFNSLMYFSIHKVGRRRILPCSIPFMILGLLSASFGFTILPIDIAAQLPAESKHRGAVGLVLASVIIYVASFALGLGNVPSMQSELYPLVVRSLGSGVATAVNWAGDFVIGVTFLTLMDLLSPSWMFVLYAAICTIGYYGIYRTYLEMAGT